MSNYKRKTLFSNKKNTKIILIHGFLGSSLNMKPLENFLINLGYSTILFDLPGHGIDFKNFTKAGRNSWINKIKEEFYNISDDSNVVIIGFSMGASLSIVLLNDILKSKIKDIKNITKLVLLSTPFSINKKFFPSFFQVLLGFIIKKKYKLKYENPGCNYLFYTKYYEQKIEYIPSIRFLDLYFLIYKSKKGLKNLFIPTLMVHSKKDKLAPYKANVKIYNRLKNKNISLVTFSRSNHFLQLDFERENLFELIKIFIENDNLQ